MPTISCPDCAAFIPEGFKFCGECGAKLQPTAARTPQAPAPAPSVVAAQPRDELRDVTILFADMTGFTAMAERLDPEAVHEIMNSCFAGLGKIVQANGGHIDKYIGDSIMALFGAPTAHEDDPLRAGETALEMLGFLANFDSRGQRRKGQALDFKMRIGLNCGLVLAGAIGSGTRRDYSVMGDAVNIASRLEATAMPGTILVSEDFKRRVEHHFVFSPGRSVKLKGKERPINCFTLDGERRAASAGMHGSGEPFVGRIGELDRIRSALRAPAPVSPWIEVRGPLGIGKTRLVDEALADERKSRVVRAVSRPGTAARPFALMRRVLHALFQEFAGNEPPRDRDQLAATLQPISKGLEPYITAIWYLAAPDNMGVTIPDPDPLTFRRTVERGLEILLTNLANLEKPPLLFLDDFHLCDPGTRDFLERASKSAVVQLPAVLTTVRPESPPSQTATEIVHLGGLDSSETNDLIRRLTLPLLLPGNTQTDIIERSGGVPLFVKELIRKCQDDRSAGVAPSISDRTGSSSALPSSLLGLMISRLDRLEAPMREFLSQCSVQGPDFSAAIASRIWSKHGSPPADAGTLLRDLEERQLLRPLEEGDQRWTFGQVLMQNACYDQMLRRDRRELHMAVAAEMIAEAGDETKVSAEILANHYELSEQWPFAARQNVRAGDRAASLYANTDALSRYSRAVTALDEMDAGAGQEVATRLAANRGAALVGLRVGDYAASRRHAESMLGVAAHPADRAEAIRLKALGLVHIGELDAADRLLSEAQTLAAGTANGPLVSRIAYNHADVSHRLGRNADAQDYINTSRAHCDPAATDTIRLDILEGRLRHTEGRFKEATDLYTRAHRAARLAGSLSEEALSSNWMGNAARDAGHYDQAGACFSRALEVWNRTGLTESIAGAHNNLANLAVSRGDFAEAATQYNEALVAFEKIGNTSGTATALMNLAILAIESAEPEVAVERAEAARALLDASGNRVLLGLAHVIKGEALIEIKQLHEASQAFDCVFQGYTETSHPLAVAGAYRGVGRIEFASERYGDAVAALERGLVLFERLKRVQEAARTEVHLAKALAAAGDLDNARKNLENARKRFAEIGASRDLERAAAVELRRKISS